MNYSLDYFQRSALLLSSDMDVLYQLGQFAELDELCEENLLRSGHIDVGRKASAGHRSLQKGCLL